METVGPNGGHGQRSSLEAAEGIQVNMTDEMCRRWRHVIPREAISEDGYLRLNPDRDFVSKENERSLQNALSENSWPAVHYLWKQHPVMQWANDKAGQLVGRQEAPIQPLKNNGFSAIIASALEGRVIGNDG